MNLPTESKEPPMKNRINKAKETGPFLRQEFIPEKRIQRFAVEELTRYSLLPGSPGPVAIEKFCDRKWGFPEDYQALDADVMGRASFTYKGFDRIEINAALVEDSTPTGVRRVRSTLAHEIGHAVLHEGLFVEKLLFDRNQGLLFGDLERSDRSAIVCRNTDIYTPAKSKWWEIQANKFMAALLLPKPLFLQVAETKLANYDEATALPRNRVERYYGTINEVADVFNVSRTMATIAVDEYLAKGRDRSSEHALF